MKRYLVEAIKVDKFPSPAGVNYYEYMKEEYWISWIDDSFRPQQGLTIMNLDRPVSQVNGHIKEFPSPAGVNYYELFVKRKGERRKWKT